MQIIGKDEDIGKRQKFQDIESKQINLDGLKSGMHSSIQQDSCSNESYSESGQGDDDYTNGDNVKRNNSMIEIHDDKKNNMTY